MQTTFETFPSNTQFSIELCDYPELPETQRERAEARYARTLERQLGDARSVCALYTLMEQLQETSPEDIPPNAPAMYQRRLKAVQAATEAGMQGLGEAETAYFSIRLQ